MDNTIVGYDVLPQVQRGLTESAQKVTALQKQIADLRQVLKTRWIGAAANAFESEQSQAIETTFQALYAFLNELSAEVGNASTTFDQSEDQCVSHIQRIRVEP